MEANTRNWTFWVLYDMWVTHHLKYDYVTSSKRGICPYIWVNGAYGGIFYLMFSNILPGIKPHIKGSLSGYFNVGPTSCIYLKKEVLHVLYDINRLYLSHSRAT